MANRSEVQESARVGLSLFGVLVGDLLVPLQHSYFVDIQVTMLMGIAVPGNVALAQESSRFMALTRHVLTPTRFEF